MAAEIMKFDTEKAKDVSGQLEDAAKSIEEVLAQLQRTLESARDWWIGSSVDSYVAQFKRIEDPVGKLIDSVRTIKMQIESTIGDKEEQETAIRGILDQSFTSK